MPPRHLLRKHSTGLEGRIFKKVMCQHCLAITTALEVLKRPGRHKAVRNCFFFLKLQRFNSSPCCSDVKVTAQGQYKMTSLLGLVTHSHARPHPSVMSHAEVEQTGQGMVKQKRLSNISVASIFITHNIYCII